MRPTITAAAIGKMIVLCFPLLVTGATTIWTRQQGKIFAFVCMCIFSTLHECGFVEKGKEMLQQMKNKTEVESSWQC